MAQTATPGRIVLYTLSATDVQQINAARGTSEGSARGNNVNAGDTYPMIVVRVWSGGSGVNGQVLLDGTDTYWATSRTEGEGEGHWQWPPRA